VASREEEAAVSVDKGGDVFVHSSSSEGRNMGRCYFFTSTYIEFRTQGDKQETDDR
jgi:hypothetical protein